MVLHLGLSSLSEFPPSLLPQFSMTSSLTSRIVLAPAAAAVSFLLPPSVVASLLHEGCQMCPPVRVVLHVPLSQLLLLHLQP